MEGGSAAGVKTTTSREGGSATDARRQNLVKT